MRRLVLSLAILAALAVAGCGSSDDGSTTQVQDATGEQSSALTKSQWIAQADAICKQYNQEFAPYEEELDALRSEALTAESAKEVAEILRRGVKGVYEEIEDLRALEPPAGDRVVVAKMLDVVEANAHTTETFASIYEEMDIAGSKSVSEEIAKGQAEANGMAQGYGLRVCGAND